MRVMAAIGGLPDAGAILGGETGIRARAGERVPA
jgi:hypothetical protein